MRQPVVAFNTLKHLFACCLLLIGFALPLSAWAVDTDGDGRPDNVDLTPLNGFNASYPWVKDHWSVGTDSASGYFPATLFGGTGGALMLEVYVPSGTGTLSFRATKPTSGIGSDTSWDIGYAVSGGCNTGYSCNSPVYSLPAGTHTLIWSAGSSCYGGLCKGVKSHVLNTLVSSNIYIAPTITEDNDDDNDGVLDVNDAFPLKVAASSDTDLDGFPDSWKAACNAACQAASGLVLDTDDDNDGLLDVNDNCPVNSNADQLNTDGDTQGNACDTDDDNDGVLDTTDQCPLDPACFVDTDGDGIDNAIDTDDDGDNLLDENDNCSSNANANQLDTDNDAQGDACDTDDDNDGVADSSDKFPLNIAASSDTDNDGFAGSWNAACDTICQNNSGLVLDNCPSNSNADQLDDDNDGVGNPCDSDGPGKLDATFNPGTGANSHVKSVVLQADGKVLIGGYFTTVNGVARNRIARLNSDGSLDAGFNPGTGVTDTVMSVVPQADGKVLIGGDFTTVNGVSRNRIVRLNSDGSLDASFNPGTGVNNTVLSVAPQTDGKVLIGGNFTTVNGVTRNYIARLNSDGSLDTSFNPGTGANNTVYSVALQADGKVLIGGGFSTVNGVSRNRIGRLDADGSLDTSFNPGTGANYTVTSVVPQADGKVLIGGNFTTVNGVTHNCIARLNTDGSLDTSFNSGTGANNTVTSVALQSDGKVLIGGTFTAVNGVTRNRIARLNSDGSLDMGFNPGTGANNSIYSVALQSDGKALIGGVFTNYNGTDINRIARIHTGDADQDGIEDAADYFSNNAAAALDTDRDGLPDAWLQPNSFGCVAHANSCNGLTLDDDNDNDGAPDYLDPEPLNPANSSVWPLNNHYQGSAVNESQTVQ